MPSGTPNATLLFYPRLALSVLGFFAASAHGVGLALVRRDRSRVAYDTAQMLMRLMRRPLGIRTRVLGRENMDARRPCIYLSNHQSAYDIPVLAELFPPDTVVIGKRELSNIPLFGWVFSATGNILIDRKNNPTAVGQMRDVEEAIRVRGVSVWMFPEGTRGRVPGKLLPFKKGAFYMAVATGVPVVPIVVEPLQPYFDPKRRHLKSGELEVRVLEPVEPGDQGEKAVTELIETVQSRMQDTLSEMAERQRRELGTPSATAESRRIL
ncbi:1-acylglycerol-3-phosphate O-acyltransferase [soil metagenome]